MATTKLGLPEITGNMTADVPRDFNALAQAVDNKAAVANGLATLGADGKVPANQLNLSSYATTTAVQGVNDALGAHQNQDATTSAKGHVQLTNSVTSTSTTTAATPNSVKQTYDLAASKQNALPVQQRRNIYISSTAPASPSDGDIWIEV